MPKKMDGILLVTLAWLVRIGLFRSVIAVTAVSIALSLAFTGLHLQVFLAEPVPYDQWVFTAIAVPSIVAPLVSSAVLSLAYRLIAAQTALELAVRTDHLTGIGNRRAFFDLAERELARFVRGGKSFSILIVDVDHFKTLNDRHGHAAGDEALIAIATLCASILRRSDLFCRWGGEEFIALLPDTEMGDAVKVAEKLRTAMHGLVPASGHELTCSIGAATSTTGRHKLDEIIREADRQLYLAKAQGRDRTMPQPPGLPAHPMAARGRSAIEGNATSRRGGPDPVLDGGLPSV
ncbi:MAG: GGDEF domain-containing protein [Phreatobacter sp.]|uniref:GGDEF domain-containing protein n=1 Tax=Phreatobacter sp. TaxID=1966341 RepID=UPI0027371FC0|nr:GGDEF domain-containing protein [Phreatobacter sp.]MDP2800366.1 GGDEF domain-containing protein [Phreatobacter sp.]